MFPKEINDVGIRGKPKRYTFALVKGGKDILYKRHPDEITITHLFLNIPDGTVPSRVISWITFRRR